MTSARPFFMWFLLVGMAKKGEFSFAVLSAMETGKDKDLSRI